MSNRRRLRVPGRYEPQPQVHAVQEPAEAIRPLVQALAGSIRRKAVAESAATLDRPATRTSVTEASVGGATTTRPGRMLVRLIKAGISLNGNAYSAHVLREAAQNKAWAKGCQTMVDHASEEEEQQHPSGSVKNLAGVLTEDARWDEGTQSLVAEVRLFEPWRGPLTDMAESIGMSIRAWVSGEHGVYEGQDAFVVQRIEQGRSVDFVTVPAAGGAIISVLEAVGNPVAIAEAANLGAWLESRLHLTLTQYADDMYGDGQLTREERIVLSGAIGDGLQAWTARVERDAGQLFQRSRWAEPETEPAMATVAAGESTTAEPEASQDSPADAPAQSAPTTPVVIPDVTDGAPPSAPETPSDPEEEPVSGIQTGAPPEQAGIATVPDNGQPPTAVVAPAVEAAPQPTAEAMSAAVRQMLAEAMRPLTEQLAQVTARENARDAEGRNLRNRQTAAEAVTAALRDPQHADVTASIAGRVNTRVLADVPTTTEGAVDDARLGEVITAVIADEAIHVRRERANALAEAGVGLPYGLGATTAQESVDDGLDAELETFFSGSLGMDSAAAKIAARGRG
jgi:hypothetical protein